MSERCEYQVTITRYGSDGYSTVSTGLVAKFACKGDAIAYAIYRAHTLPEGELHVIFEVHRGQRREYRAG